MRPGLVTLAFLLVVLGPNRALRAQEEPAAEKPAGEMTEAEREAALRQAEELDRRIKSLLREGRYRDAVPHAREALALREASLGGEHPDVADSLNELAFLLKRLGAYREAREHYDRSLAIRERALGSEHPDVATSLNNIAMLLLEQGAHEEARPLLERSLAIREKTLGPSDPEVARSLNNLASLLRELGAFAEAWPLYERSLAIRREALGPGHPDVATCLNNMALLLWERGAYEQALPLYEQALSIREMTLGAYHPAVARSLNNLALLLKRQGAYEEAKALFERSLAIRERSLGKDHPAVGTCLSNLGSVLTAQGAYAAARPLYERALRVHENAYGPEHPAVATDLNNLALLLKHQGAYEEARALFERSLAIRERSFGKDHPTVGTCLNNLAAVLVAAGDLEGARPLYERALQIAEEAYVHEHPSVAMTLHNLAWLFQEQGHYEQAAHVYGDCLGVLELLVRRQFAGLQASGRRRLVAASRYCLDHWLGTAPEVGRSGYAEALRFKGLVARATWAERRLLRQGGAAAAERVLRLRAAERRLSNLANSMPPRMRKERHEAWRKAYAKAAAAREERALALARDFAPLRSGQERMDLLLGDIRGCLGPHEVLLDVLRSGGRYFAWIVRAEGAVERVDLGEAAVIEGAAAAFSELAADESTDPTDDAWIEAGRTLRDLVITPIEHRLGEAVRTIYLCPDAALAAVPFAALPGREEGRYLADDYLPVQVSMAADLVPWKEALETGTGTLAVGDVDYVSASTTTEDPVGPSPVRVAAVDRAPTGRSFGPIPETRDEVEFIQKRLGETCSVLLGRDATEARFRAESKGKRILHLATHGFIRGDLMRGLRHRNKDDHVWLGADMERQLAVGHDPMNLAGLALAGANPCEGGHGDDGILTATEASYLDLDGVDLVVLSACETALGKAESGEGVIGLVQGFQMAGAKRVIASLWQVDDEATRLLMQHLYDGMCRKRNPLSPAEALREAASKVRSSTGSHGQSFAAPRYWASFVCYGR